MEGMSTCLWFDGNAEEAAKFYASIFPNTKIGAITRYGDAGPKPKGTVMTVEFNLLGQRFVGLNGGPEFKFNEAVSFVVECESQEEVDRLWKELGAGGTPGQCGWLKDKYGVSWQIVPIAFLQMLKDKNAKKVDRAMTAMMKMTKLDLAKLEQAYRGEDGGRTEQKSARP